MHAAGLAEYGAERRLEPSIETTRGRLTGTLSRGVATFRGIPYARPPLGALRFQPPQPAEPWSGERRATRPGPVPVQAALPYFRFVNAGGALFEAASGAAQKLQNRAPSVLSDWH